jgi:multidrug efflux pump subunit AcrB
MRGLIRASLSNPYAVIVMTLTIAGLGVWTLMQVPRDILPVFRSPAVQVLTFYGGMPAKEIEKDITIRMERWTGQANGIKKQESRSIMGASIVRNYFQDDQDISGSLTQISTLSQAITPYLPPGTLPSVVMPFDPTSTTPIALVALDSKSQPEAILYDTARYEVRNMIMQNKGANAPVVIGGKMRAVMLYLNETQMQAHKMSAGDVMAAVERYNLFFASGDVKIGNMDYALNSNSMFKLIQRMGDIPVNKDSKPGNPVFLDSLAEPKDAAFIQTNIVRVNGRKQVYIPIYRQIGASTLDVIDTLNATLPEMKIKILAPDIDLKVVMDQSIYVRASIAALTQEGLIGAVLCSLVILVFLGQMRMTIIAIVTLPLSVLMAIIGLYYSGHTINVMTLAGLTLAIGPMIDSAIICLENTHRHLTLGASPRRAAFDGASEVAMPELVSTLCTFLVLSPLALMPGMGRFLFLPMTLAVMFSMTTAYLLSRTLVPCASAYLLTGHAPGHEAKRGPLGNAFARWEKLIDQGIAFYVRILDVVLAHRVKTVVIAFVWLLVTLAVLTPVLRRDFFPEVDSGAFEIAARAPAGTRIEVTEKLIEKVENYVTKHIPKEDLKLIVSEIGLTSDWSAAYTPNSGTMDAVVKVQLEEHRSKTSQQYIRILRAGLENEPALKSLEFSFDSGGLVRGALNEGKSSPLNIQLVGKNQEVLFSLADKIKKVVQGIDGIVDARVLQKPDAPQLTINVNRAKAARLGLNQDEIMKSVIAATNSSIAYNKRNFWIDPISGNQYFVGVQYPETHFHTKADILNIPITGVRQSDAILLANVVDADNPISEDTIPTEIHHVNLQKAIDLTMNVEGRDLGHVSDELARKLNRFGVKHRVKPIHEPGSWGAWSQKLLESVRLRNKNGSWDGSWVPIHDGKPQESSRIVLTGEYARMQDTFINLGVGLIFASLLIYFLMVALDKSFIVPLAVMLIVPLCLIGILPMLYITGSAVNVQSLLGFIFIVGIKVANTVLMTDCAQELRRHEGLTPLEAIRKAASLRVRPVTMTALAAFFAMVPTALALEPGSEANAPLARAILGGLIAGEPATLFVLPALYAIMVRGQLRNTEEDESSPVIAAPAH